MTDSLISLPESVSMYFRDRATKRAIDRVLEATILPPDLFIDEVVAFHEVALSAQKIKTDYLSFLYQVWKATWGTAIAKHLLGSEEVKVSDLVDDVTDRAPTLDYVWDEGAFYVKSKIGDKHSLWTISQITDDLSVRIAFWVDSGDGDYSVSDTIPLGDAWMNVNEDNTRYSVAGLCVVKDNQADIGTLAGAAQDAILRLTQLISG